jgi:kinesin family protein 15
LNEKEFTSTVKKCVTIKNDNASIILDSKPEAKIFSFDYSAGENISQEEVFHVIGEPITRTCVQGYNGTILCYGQTGSGKTHTMFGPDICSTSEMESSRYKEQRGLVPRVLEYLWQHFEDAKTSIDTENTVVFTCKCSFYEIYQEKVFDLLDTSNTTQVNNLSIREDTKIGVYVEGLIDSVVESPSDAKRILSIGYRNRHVGETAMNRESSRSHAVFQLTTEATTTINSVTTKRLSRFSMVDLAGSERQKDTHTTGERLKEASVINKSLSALGNVINALADNSGLTVNNPKWRHVHYRDSKLTFLLRDSIGGNSKVCRSLRYINTHNLCTS